MKLQPLLTQKFPAMQSLKKKRETSKPDSVAKASSHSSRGSIAAPLKRPLRSLAENHNAPFGLASDRVCRLLLSPKAGPVHKTGHFTLPAKRTRQRYTFCCTFRGLSAPSVSLVSSPVKSRLSSPALPQEERQRLPCFPKKFYEVVRERRLLGFAVSSDASASCASIQ